MNQEEYQIYRGVNMWMIFFTVVFILTTALFYYILMLENKLPYSIGIFDFTILSLATFRMVRLFVYDAIFLFLREGLMDTEEGIVDGETSITFIESKSALKRTLYKLAICPWCMGVWIALCSLFVFYLFPGSYILFLILAVAAFGSIMQVLANLIGWHAEYNKVETAKLKI